MLFQYRYYFLILILSLTLVGCRSTDPFQKEVQNSSLNLALQFAQDFRDFENEDALRKAHDRLDSESRDLIPFSSFSQAALAANSQEDRNKVEIQTWEKISLKDGDALIYLLEKYDFKKLRLKYMKYAILRIRVTKEDGVYKVKFDSSSEFSGIDQLFEGNYQEMDELGISRLRRQIKENAEDYQFQESLKNKKTPQVEMVEKCLQLGEELYDQEEYRKALMQFQKALSIDPENEKARTYRTRCKKAISLGLEK